MRKKEEDRNKREFKTERKENRLKDEETKRDPWNEKERLELQTEKKGKDRKRRMRAKEKERDRQAENDM